MVLISSLIQNFLGNNDKKAHKEQLRFLMKARDLYRESDLKSRLHKTQSEFKPV